MKNILKCTSFLIVKMKKKSKPRFWKEFNFFVYCEENVQFNLPAKIFQNFLIEENGEISLNAMTMFTERDCRKIQLTRINRFSNFQRKWKTEKFSVGEIKNFHGCKLVFELSQLTQLPFLSFTVKDEFSFYKTIQSRIIRKFMQLKVFLLK